MSEIKLTIDGTEYEFEVCFGALAGSTPTLYFNNVKYLGKAIPKQVAVPEYEILSFKVKYPPFVIFKKMDNGMFGNLGDGIISEKDMISIGHEIYSVKRVSDGETFSLRDICQSETGYVYCPIKRFFIKDELMYVQFDEGHGNNDGCLTINSIQKAKPKQVLFTDEFGNNVYEGENVYSVRKVDWYDSDETFEAHAGSMSLGINRKKNVWWYFLSKQDKDRFILENKPIMVSYKEIADLAPNHIKNQIFLVDTLKDFFKSKIRQ